MIPAHDLITEHNSKVRARARRAVFAAIRTFRADTERGKFTYSYPCHALRNMIAFEAKDSKEQMTLADMAGALAVCLHSGDGRGPGLGGLHLDRAGSATEAAKAMARAYYEWDITDTAHALVDLDELARYLTRPTLEGAGNFPHWILEIL